MTAKQRRGPHPRARVLGAWRGRRPALLLALAGVTACASLTVFGSPNQRVRPDLLDGAVWLPSTGPGLLTQMNGVALSPQFQLPMPVLRGQRRVTVADVDDPGGRAGRTGAPVTAGGVTGSLVVTGFPDGSGNSAYSLVDPVGLRVEGPFTGSGTCTYTVVGPRMYCVDSSHGDLVAVPPRTEPRWERRVRLGRSLGQLAHDRDGTLWVGLPSAGAVAALPGGSGQGGVRRTSVGEPGDRVWLATVGGEVFAVDTDGGFFVALRDDGAPVRVPLPESVASPRDPVVGLGAPSSSARHLVLLLRSGTLVSVDPRTGAEVATVRTGVPTDARLGGNFVEAGDLVYLPRGDDGRVLVVDMGTGHLRAPVRVTSAAASLQLLERAGSVWIHDPDGPEGVMVRSGRAHAFRKYDPGKPPVDRHGRDNTEPPPSASPTPTSDRPGAGAPTPTASATHPTSSPSPRHSPRPGASDRPPSDGHGTGRGEPTPGPGDGGLPTPTDGGGTERPPPAGGPTAPSGLPTDSQEAEGRPTRVATLPVTGSLAFRPDGAVLALNDQLWDVSDPARAHRLGALPYDRERGALYLVSPVFTPDGTTVFARGRYVINSYGVQDPTAPRQLTGWDSSHPSSGLALSADGRKLAYGFSDLLGRSGSFLLMDVSDPSSPRLITGGGIQVRSPVWHTSISADGTLVAASLDDDMAVLDVSHPTPGTEETGPGPATQLSLMTNLGRATFAPRGRLLAARDKGNGWVLLSLANPTNPRTVARQTDLKGITDLRFSQDGGRLALLGDGGTPGTGTAQVWDVSRPDRPRLLHRMAAPDGAALAFDPTGTLLAVPAGSGTELWRIP